MTTLTPSEKQLYETRQHRTKLWLSIYQPEVALAAQINDAGIAKGDVTITYDGVTQGNHNLVEESFTMLVGTEAGKDDKGHIRVRSVDASEITVPANSSINWANNDHLTILRFLEIWPMYQRIIQDPADELNTLWYKDYDVAYTNQNSVLGSFVCMGCHYAGFLDPGTGECEVYYTASGTHNFKSDNLTFDWWFQGAASGTGSTAHTPGYITYDTPGHYTTKIEVDNASGGTDTSYRHVSIYDRPGRGADVPFKKWDMDELTENRDSGTVSTRIRVYDDGDEVTIRDGALIVIFAEDWYGDTKQSIGGNAMNRSSIFFCGYILSGTIEYNYQEGYAEFEVASPTEVMHNMEAFSIDVTSSTNPAGQAAADPNHHSGWTLLLNMNVERAIYHYLRWHSTALLCNDMEFSGTDQLIEHFTSDRQSLFDGVNTLMDRALAGEFCCDRQGKMFAEVSMAATNNASGSFPTSMELSKFWWAGEPSLDEQQIPAVSYIEIGGIQYDGPAAGTFSAFMCCAPGTEPGFRGKIEQKQGLALTSQAQLNTLAGNLFAWKNALYPRFGTDLSGNYRSLDVAPQETVPITLESDDTPRGITFSQKPFTPRGMTWRYDPVNEQLNATIELHELTQGFAADTIVIPDVPPTEGGEGGGGYSIPGISVPPLPEITTPSLTLTVPVLSLHSMEIESSVATGTYLGNAIEWEDELINTLGMWSIVTGSSNSTVTFTTAGDYLIWSNFYGYFYQLPDLGGKVEPLDDIYLRTKFWIEPSGIPTNLGPTDYRPFSIGYNRLLHIYNYQSEPVISGMASVGLPREVDDTLQCKFILYITGNFDVGVAFYYHAHLQIAKV